ncbi:tetratricopeptide repeat protein [Pontibacter ummariensis]|uniref:Tetratricopeptide repeat-containing protein n=1 Tax=Pontibacter ummariensis TaxID=1610492 RepID=A0A239CVB5_9BACT|nr:tetratricopeptide repeat protein [Pontibacter ummariensis]PRY14823.1 tetratricopeptide repeat protein [Pontibacter ummariensis]SNS23738.1 Tetratricopeptide repeat-containing protein [Pontibacter ummariensis]
MNKKPLHVLFLLTGLLLAGCSAERNNPLSKAYHNTTARYNGYFLAKEKMRLVEEGLKEKTQYDYNQVLPIYPPLDSLTAKAMAAELEDIKKKASHPIQYHKNSKWIDNSYIVIGKANFYELNYQEAVRTFKYVNANSKQAADRHEALVWLMRSFIQLGEMENAQQVSEHLRKERLNRENARELYLARAQYHFLEGDTTSLIENLALSLPNFENRDDQSRARFTLAQLYQLTNQNQEAYEHYSQILGSNPPYDLGFFSRLYLGQVTELSDAQDKERIEKYYEKLLKDEKNKEYRDKIYYEMAQFELRQQHYDKALNLLQQSLKTPGTLANQKAYSYVAAGEIYFDKLHKYDLSAAYYDSAVQVYPKGAREYEAVAERRDVLADFALQYNTIQTQDSLQHIARMPETERTTYLEQLVQQEEEARQQALALQQEKQEQEKQQNRSNSRNQNDSAFPTESSANGVWYFDNPTAMASAHAEFVRRWGDRPNQDFWRTRRRGESTNEAEVVRTPAVATIEKQLSPEERAQVKLQEYLKALPLTTAAMLRSEKQVEEALFRLGNIYAQHLADTERGITTYEELLKRFPKTEHAAETYYSLYLLYGKSGDTAKQQAYYQNIKQQFPNTTFARLLDDAGFMTKNAADNEKAHVLYDSAYAHYRAQEYAEAKKQIDQLVSQYPLNDIQDKVAFLEALLIARTEKPEVLKEHLQRFKAKFKGSSLLPQADQLLASYQELEQTNQLRKDAPPAPAPKLVITAQATPEEKVSTEIATATASVSHVLPQTPPATPTVKEPFKEEAKAVAAQAEAAAPKQTAIEPDIKEEAAGEQTKTAELNLQPDSASTSAVPIMPDVDALAYEAAVDSAYYFVLVYPSGEAAFKDVLLKYEKYNNTYYKNQGLAIDSASFSAGKSMLVMRTFTDPKLALSYNIKQKAPQAPVGRIRGVDFTTFVISSANYQKFLQKKDLDAYLTFFKNNY